MIRNKIVLLCLLICLHLLAGAQTPAPVKWLLQAPYMRGASFSLVVKDVQEGRTVYSYDTDRLQSPASVLKTVSSFSRRMELVTAVRLFDTFSATSSCFR